MEKLLNVNEWKRLMDLHLERFVEGTRTTEKHAPAEWRWLFEQWLTREVAGGNAGNTDG